MAIPAYAAFGQLARDRPMGAMGGAGPIPFTSMSVWWDRHGADAVAAGDLEDFDDLVRWIAALDGAWLAEETARVKAQARRKPVK